MAIHLGSGEEGTARRRALEKIADEAGYTWGGRPSIGRWLIATADFFLGHGRAPRPDEIHRKT